MEETSTLDWGLRSVGKMKETTYKTIQPKELNKDFELLSDEGEFITLKHLRGKNTIKIHSPFILDEDVAKLAGMMPDGSLIKDLRRIYFGQDKDLSKIYLFRDLLIKKFSPNNKVFVGRGNAEYRTFINSTTLANFFYHVLKIPKSDEQMNVPQWVFNSPDSVKYAYLREAFAMEGTILKNLYEIRFITKDNLFAVSIKKLLKSVDIESHITERIGGTPPTLQYRVSIYRRENFERFCNIGFSLPFHRERFRLLLIKYHINKSFN
ncbi:hypothetical protein HYV85_02730 [Candidatus Woesearchaeota archaeon]|nr:hypothetical protein [Candidatus Woesearchaeota archaeon]